ncbi:hypothetical protein LLEC1_05046, partial [Akanthomyces lecanii]
TSIKTMESNSKQCWECRRRCLVCDFTLPACNRCREDGVDCPGHGASKPESLEWHTPGMFTSNICKGRGSCEPGRSRSFSRGMKPLLERRITTPGTLSTSTVKSMSLNLKQSPTMPDAKEMLDAVIYYNYYIYPEMLPMAELGTKCWLFPLCPSYVQRGLQRPDHVRFSLFAMTLGHRLNRTPNEDQQEALAKRYYEYRGGVIESLTESIQAQQNQPNDFILAGILTLMLTDAQNGAALNSRCHLEAISRIITLRGGIGQVARAGNLDSLLLCYMSTAVFANTTAPATDLLMTESHASDLRALTRHFDPRTFLFSACPVCLFSEIVSINHLRRQATRPGVLSAERLHDEAVALLRSINRFRPLEWSASKPACRPDWELLGAVYHSAAILYCVSSMQSLSVLAPTIALTTDVDVITVRLQAHLKLAVLSPRLNRFVFWPLMVLGVQAARGSNATRIFVAEEMSRMSFRTGTCVPSLARTVLERFWASGETHWDACFDQPYVFTTQIAVDTSRVEA